MGATFLHFDCQWTDLGALMGEACRTRNVKLMIDITLPLKDIEYAGFRESGVH